MDTQLARKTLDRKLDLFPPVDALRAPPRGWVRAIREALGMTAVQFARRLKVSQPRITKLEKAELDGTLSIASLKKAADALNCDLVYALVPRRPLDQLVNDRAKAKAAALVSRVNHTMTLENQAVANESLAATRDALAAELIRTSPRRLWDDT